MRDAETGIAGSLEGGANSEIAVEPLILTGIGLAIGGDDADCGRDIAVLTLKHNVAAIFEDLPHPRQSRQAAKAV